MPTDSAYQENTYVFDNEDMLEIVRLSFQDRLLTETMKSSIPERTDFSNMHSILDLACGTGGWVLDVAWEHPTIEVTGVDINQHVIPYALAQARTQRLDNARFQKMNILEPLDFPDNAFDLINARLLFAVVPPSYWPQLLQECYRLLRPGGILRLTEWEFSFVSSAAFEHIIILFIQAMKRIGRSVSPDGRHLGVTPLLVPLLKQAGYQHIQTMPHIVDWSVGTEAHEGWHQNTKVLLQTARPFLLETGVVTAEEYDNLHQQTLFELLANDFCGILFVLTAWGEKG